MLSRVVPLRRAMFAQQQQKLDRGAALAEGDRVYPLKLVIMSATLRTADFTGNARLFTPPPPLIQVRPSYDPSKT